MSFLKNSIGFTRFRISDPVPPSLWPEITDLLRRNSFTDIDELPEERSAGWTAYGDLLDSEFTSAPVEKGPYITFALRLDTRRVPPGVIKKHLALAIKKEEGQNRETGRKFIARERRKELKEQVLHKLRMRFLPTPAEFEVVWNTADSVIFFASTRAQMLDLFEELFVRTFNLHLTPLTPFELAASLSGDSTLLEGLEATEFNRTGKHA
ncbi:MAG: recombination-associated protein RdgC [Desulfovibrio sp.]|jgi:DNA recombination-dependent growth factor C|nr:recombination-associated protein RdgC [Desulfovibrio sp.]